MWIAGRSTISLALGAGPRCRLLVFLFCGVPGIGPVVAQPLLVTAPQLESPEPAQDTVKVMLDGGRIARLTGKITLAGKFSGQGLSLSHLTTERIQKIARVEGGTDQAV